MSYEPWPKEVQEKYEQFENELGRRRVTEARKDQEIVELKEQLRIALLDTKRINQIEAHIPTSRTGISFDKIPTCEDEPGGFRFMRYHKIFNPEPSLRRCIDMAFNPLESEI